MPKRDSAVFDVVAVKPYVGTWEEFAAGAKKIYLRSPAKARFTQKYRHCDGALVLKMTDDVLVRVGVVWCASARGEREGGGRGGGGGGGGRVCEGVVASCAPSHSHLSRAHAHSLLLPTYLPSHPLTVSEVPY